MNPKKIKTFFAAIALFSYSISSFVYADNVDVTASLKGGAYNGMIKVELNTTVSGSKTFFSFDPNGTPNDAFLYTGAILIKKSTPLVFFTFVDKVNESKIKQEDYIISYVNDVRLSTGATIENSKISNLYITNISSSPIDISYWYLKNDTKTTEIPAGTILNPGQNYDITAFADMTTISLFSPNDEKKDFTDIKEAPKTEMAAPATEIKKVSYIRKPIAKSPTKRPVVAMVTAPTGPVPENSAINIDTNTTKENQQNPTENSGQDSALEKNLGANNTDNETPANPVATEANNKNDPKPTNIGNNLKASVTESQSSDKTGNIVILLVVGSAIAAGVGRMALKKVKK